MREIKPIPKKLLELLKNAPIVNGLRGSLSEKVSVQNYKQYLEKKYIFCSA